MESFYDSEIENEEWSSRFSAAERARCLTMPKRVTLDAMINREDFGLEGEEKAVDLIRDFPIANLADDSPILKLLRKPDFQRETNHWTPDQFVTFVASFVDNEVIPSLILWKSSSFVFVIDGGHRLSALRAWMADDYGDMAISHTFFGGEISEEQKKVARLTRKLVEERVGKYSTLHELVGKPGTDKQTRRANSLFTRTIPIQWIQGSADVAETSFFKINSQGTPLDEVEEMLIRNRRKPIAISARAILRAGAGHKYWSAFSVAKRDAIKNLASQFHKLLFEPELHQPWKTIDVPLGGSSSPVEALALLIEFLTTTGTREKDAKKIEAYDDDVEGDGTIDILTKSLEVIARITGNSAGSLGLHPAVYFYNEKGKYSRFFFLAMSLLITDKLRANDDDFFRRFTKVRAEVESFLVENKSLVALLPQNLGRHTRVPKMRDFLGYLIAEHVAGREITTENAIAHIGLRQRIIALSSTQAPTHFTDDVKSEMFITKALKSAHTCPICGGVLDPQKSVSYDHKVPIRLGGKGDVQNGDLVHPYCNSAIKN